MARLALCGLSKTWCFRILAPASSFHRVCSTEVLVSGKNVFVLTCVCCVCCACVACVACYFHRGETCCVVALCESVSLRLCSTPAVCLWGFPGPAWIDVSPLSLNFLGACRVMRGCFSLVFLWNFAQKKKISQCFLRWNAAKLRVENVRFKRWQWLLLNRSVEMLHLFLLKIHPAELESHSSLGVKLVKLQPELFLVFFN